ncbi:MAG: hypothetical protein QG583_564 [Patescibacteria group bacterium]|nr:hypothetical protein [Patescibacteria group bacterium]
MTIIFGIVFLIIILSIASSQNSRITRMEKMLQNLTIVQNVQSPLNTQALEKAPASPIQDLITDNPTLEIPKHVEEENSGKLLGKMGIGAVFLGVAFFIKYAFDNNWVDEAGRIMIGVIVGMILFGIGQYLRKEYENFSEVLMGGGIAVLYFSIFAAHSFYSLIDPFTTSIFLFLITLFSILIGIVNKDETLSIIGTIGGFVTPFLVGTQIDNMIEIFSYVTLLNLGVLVISFLKKWPNLVAVALVGTILNFIVWAVRFYETESLMPVIFFLSISFLVFLIASIYKITDSKDKAGEGEYFILAGSAIFFMIASFVFLYKDHPSMLALIYLIVGLIHLFASYLVNKNNPNDYTLNVFLPVISVVFISIAIPIQFSGLTVAVLWFIESCLLYIVASLISNRGFQIMGVVVYACAFFNFFFFNEFFQKRSTEFVAIMNPEFMTLVLGIFAAYFISWIYQKFGSLTLEIQKQGISVFVIIANILTLYAISSQIVYSHPSDSNIANTYMSVFWALYAAVLIGIGFAGRISLLRKMGIALFIVTAIKVVFDVWNLGQVYRIVSFIVFGVVALIASFAYAKYKDRLKEII